MPNSKKILGGLLVVLGFAYIIRQALTISTLPLFGLFLIAVGAIAGKQTKSTKEVGKIQSKMQNNLENRKYAKRLGVLLMVGALFIFFLSGGFILFAPISHLISLIILLSAGILLIIKPSVAPKIIPIVVATGIAMGVYAIISFGNWAELVKDLANSKYFPIF